MCCREHAIPMQKYLFPIRLQWARHRLFAQRGADSAKEGIRAGKSVRCRVACGGLLAKGAVFRGKWRSAVHPSSQRAAFRASSLHRFHPIGPTQQNKHPPKQETEAGSQPPDSLFSPQNNGAEPKEAQHPKSARKPAYTGHSATGNREEHPQLPRNLKTREEKLGQVKEKTVPLQPVRLNQHPTVLDEQTQLCAAHCKRTAALQ